MSKIDCFRHYLSVPGIVAEGFLGQQNPALGFQTLVDGQLGLVVRGLLTTVDMYSPGQFGVDIYLPLSTLDELCESIRQTGIVAGDAGRFTAYDPQGTERGPKQVPTVVLNMGRISFSHSQTVIKGRSWEASDGVLYIDLETHSPDSHKTWTRNPVMEPFELHLGVRSTERKTDPFTEGGFDLPAQVRHVTRFAAVPAASLLARLEALRQRAVYTFGRVDGGEWQFTLQLDDQEYTISKAFMPT